MSKPRNVQATKCPSLEMSKPRNVQASKCPSHEMSKPRNVQATKCPSLEMSIRATKSRKKRYLSDISNTTEEAVNFGVEVDESHAVITSDNVEQQTLNEAELSTDFDPHTTQEIAGDAQIAVAQAYANITNNGETVPVWEEEIFRAPHFPIPIWNMQSQATSALAHTNNGLEATHLHFMVSVITRHSRTLSVKLMKTPTDGWTLPDLSCSPFHLHVTKEIHHTGHRHYENFGGRKCNNNGEINQWPGDGDRVSAGNKPSPAGGPMAVILNGEFHRRISSMQAGTTQIPGFGQLYILDPVEAMEKRRNNPIFTEEKVKNEDDIVQGHELNEATLKLLVEMIQKHHPAAKAYKQAREQLQELLKKQNPEELRTYAPLSWHGLLEDDKIWDKTLAEAALSRWPDQMRWLFMSILVYGHPSNAVELWNKYKDQMYFPQGIITPAQRQAAELEALADLDWRLHSCFNLSCVHFGLPDPPNYCE
ncbi:hypothetical protein niasHS_000168 [Heterodera schachtii]|uniref:Uncharacterized protein n=1 Tax=Heterodera schachtii TaxID=97005 RepID=A0ABD2KC43_HETSC